MIVETDNPLLSITADQIRQDHLTMGLITLKEPEQGNDHRGFREATISPRTRAAQGQEIFTKPPIARKNMV